MPLLLTSAPSLALHAGTQVLTKAQADLGGQGGQAGTVLDRPLPGPVLQPLTLGLLLWHQAQPCLPCPMPEVPIPTPQRPYTYG